LLFCCFQDFFFKTKEVFVICCTVLCTIMLHTPYSFSLTLLKLQNTIIIPPPHTHIHKFRDYIDTHYTAPRMVICGVGAVDHDQLVELSSKYWDKDIPSTPKTSYPTNFEPATFIGGDKREARSDIEVFIFFFF
jgi:hypothetical protein